MVVRIKNGGEDEDEVTDDGRTVDATEEDLLEALEKIDTRERRGVESELAIEIDVITVVDEVGIAVTLLLK